MSDRFTADGDQTVATSPGLTALSIIGVTTVRAKLYDILVGQSGTAGDTTIQWLVRRFTVAGTATPLTEGQLDLDSPVSLTTAEDNHSAEPTFTAGQELLDFDVNQRATFRWVAAPRGEMMVPATAANGIASTPISATYTGDARTTFHWEE